MMANPGWKQATRLTACVVMSIALAALPSGCTKESARALSGQGAGKKGASGPQPVLAAVSERKDIPIEIRAVGTVEAYSTVQVKAQVGGLLMRVHFKEGQHVPKGAPLFSIDPRPFQAALHEREAQAASAKVEASNAEVELQRAASIFKKNIISREEYDRARTTAESKAAAAVAAAAAIENARLLLEYCEIRSPIDGRTGNLEVHEGNVVKANADTPMVTINQVEPIYVTFAVPEIQMPAIRRAMAQTPRLPVRVTITGEEDEPVSGTLAFLDNAISRETGTIRLKAEFENHERRLWPGLFVNVTLTLGRRENVVTIPSQAVQIGQDGSYVYVIRNDQTVESRPVVTGPLVGNDMVVEQGLAAGERVVTDGHLRLSPGAKVEIKKSL